MVENTSRRADVMFVGVGGQGVLLAGQILCSACRSQYGHILMFPNYTGAMRGGVCECNVIFSDMEIASPVAAKVQAAVVLESSHVTKFIERIKPGGVMVVESMGLKEDISIPGVKVFAVPGIKTAMNIGTAQASNFILLGVYVGASQVIQPALIEKEIENTFIGKEKVMKINREAFQKGLEMQKEY